MPATSGFGPLLDNRVLLISGATGMAEATALLAAREGARVFVVSLGEEECRALHAKLSTQTPHCASLAGDLCDAATADRAVDACVERFGRIDCLFNVAGISGRSFGDGPLHECTDEGFDTTVRVNLRTLFLLSRATLRQMLKQPVRPSGIRGTILNMATVTAYSPQSDYFATHAYAAAKGGVVSLTKAAASYYARHKIRVNAIAPGLVRTPMSKRAQSNEAILNFMKRKQPLVESLIDADDVAATSVMLLSDVTKATTGEIVSIDAGWHVSG